MEHPDDLCAMVGDESEAVTKGDHNRWMKIAVAVHLRPMKKSLDEVVEALHLHIKDENALLKKVLWIASVTLLGTVVSLVIYIWTRHFP